MSHPDRSLQSAAALGRNHTVISKVVYCLTGSDDSVPLIATTVRQSIDDDSPE